jgi:Lon protease-like protein
MNLPSVVPVMLLQQCNVFPLGMLPLYIFEPRYRAMLRHALQTDRMLCIGNLSPSDDEEAVESDDRISEFSTAAVIRACVGNEDGTSHLVLQGMQRVKFIGWEQYEPFRIARIAPLETVSRDEAAAARKSKELLNRVLGLIRPDTDTGRQLTEQLTKLGDPAHLAGNLIRDAAARQPLLGMADVGDRLEFLLDLVPAPDQRPAKS